MQFICECSELRKTKSKLENRNYVIEDAYETYIPRVPVEISEEDIQTVNTLLEEFEGHPEVDKVHTNIA